MSVNQIIYRGIRKFEYMYDRTEMKCWRCCFATVDFHYLISPKPNLIFAFQESALSSNHKQIGGKINILWLLQKHMFSLDDIVVLVPLVPASEWWLAFSAVGSGVVQPSPDREAQYATSLLRSRKHTLLSTTSLTPPHPLIPGSYRWPGPCSW